MFDGEKFGNEIVAVIKGYLERELGDIIKRLDAIEKQLKAGSKSDYGGEGLS